MGNQLNLIQRNTTNNCNFPNHQDYFHFFKQNKQITMAQNIPTEQWAQVVEQTGKPVVYKKIPVQKPGPDEVLINLKESGARPGETLAIVGAGGGLGSLACQYAKAMGLRVIAIDGGNEKKEMTAKLGAESYVDFMSSKNVVSDVKAATPDGLGPHAVILVAVNEKPFQQAAEYVRPRGTVVAIGLPAGAYLRAPVFESVIKMITIKGSYVGNRADSAEAIEFFRRGLIKAPYKSIGMSELQKVYDLMHEGKIAGRYVVDTSK